MGKSKKEGVPIKSMSFTDMLKDIEEHSKEVEKYYKESGGLCFHCKKEPSYLSLHPNIKSEPLPIHISSVYQCESCNNKTHKILQELRKDSGFFEINL